MIWLGCQMGLSIIFIKKNFNFGVGAGVGLNFFFGVLGIKFCHYENLVFAGYVGSGFCGW
jgi:hypothetical protein